MDFLETIEQPFILAIDLVRVLSRLEVDTILPILLISFQSLALQDGTTAGRRSASRWNAAFHRSISLHDLLQPPLVLILRAVEINTDKLVGFILHLQESIMLFA